MMHYNSIVVTLCDGNRRTFREYESKRRVDGRNCKVFMPFDSEYQFYVKNNSLNRVRLDIFIDGSLVTNNGLIISESTSDHIERFLDSDKKFKFVRASHEAVSDPTSPENGIIKVVAHKEKAATIISWTPPYPYWLPWITHDTFQKRYAVSPFFGDSNSPICCDNTGNISTRGSSLGSASINCVYSASVSAGEAGATVEGSFSNQTFGSTIWNGDDGIPMTFTFYVVGGDPIDTERERKMKEYLRLKEELRV